MNVAPILLCLQHGLILICLGIWACNIKHTPNYTNNYDPKENYTNTIGLLIHNSIYFYLTCVELLLIC
ncbi:uncharacterized protein DS421_1g10320 [Arachis hypogaea]|nr:uncharacterized protein DS421_1g10320 [Arachis hypogaea]